MQSTIFAVLLADDLMVVQSSVTAQLVAQFNQLQSSIVAVQDVSLEHTKRYGIVSGHIVADGFVELSDVVEKSDPKLAPSTLAVASRYILTASIFEELAKMRRGIGGGFQLTEDIANLMRKKIYAYQYSLGYCCSKLGFLQASVDFGELHHEVGDGFRAWLISRK